MPTELSGSIKYSVSLFNCGRKFAVAALELISCGLVSYSPIVVLDIDNGIPALSRLILAVR